MIVPPNGYTAVGPPETPIDWLAFLQGKLTEGRADRNKYTAYYEGEQQKLVFAQARYKTAFRDLFNDWRDNFCGLIIDSATERMKVEGFRVPSEGKLNSEAKEFWQRNSLDSLSNAVHLDAMVQGKAYVIVWADKQGEPTIQPVSADEMVVQYKPGSSTELEAAARFYLDSWGRSWVTLWTNEYVYEVPLGENQWEAGTKNKNPMKVVPVVPFHNRSRINGDPYSDLHNVIPLQDAVNKTTSDALLASEFAAWPQRWVTGLEIRVDDNDNVIEPYKIGEDKLLQAEDEKTQFGQFEAADLNNYVVFVNLLVQHLSSVSRTPSHYFLVNQGNAPSGEAIISAEAGLVSKVKERMLYFGEAWEQVIRLCFLIKKDKRATEFSLETVWADPEYRTEAQHIDSLLKLKQLNVPEEMLWMRAGFSASEIETFREMRKADAKAAKEVAELGPQEQGPTAPGGDKTAAMAKKPPQGNSGNMSRKLHEVK
ncbi:phage portal protein [Streptomyces sp. NBC_01500]|uniref:phage portal protein n=1 Tax=Streptomyces sp. NBC_01500 TaxID=2903886 RepID=UPI00225C30AF|nr:phage portal protein [Streptomyces sp. NBC_01500]MCX4554129.1 phage portal protein [Streptomyces sp. NBC_01500]